MQKTGRNFQLQIQNDRLVKYIEHKNHYHNIKNTGYN